MKKHPEPGIASLRIRLELPANQNGSNQMLIRIFATLNGIALPFMSKETPDIIEHPVMLSALRQALLQSGNYLMFVCECGDPGCSGQYVEIVNNGKSVELKAAYRTDEMGKCGTKSFEYSYSLEIEKIQAVIDQVDQAVEGFNSQSKEGHASLLDWNTITQYKA